MTPTSESPAHYVRRGLLKIDPARVLEAVDSLDLRASSKIAAVVGMPLRSLQQRRDVAAFAVAAPLPAVKGLLELLAADPLAKVIEALGDHAESPTYEQLADAVDRLQANGATDDDAVALLTFAVGEQFPAAAHCRRLLDERPAWALPELPDVASGGPVLAAKEVDPAIREQRRARREQQRQRRRSAPPTRPAGPAKSKAVTRPTRAPSPSRPVERVVEYPRRREILTPAERQAFDPEHPLVATVVLVEVPFDSVDPEIPEQKTKARPALVIAASDQGVLVRGIYSNPSTTRVLFQPWRRLEMHHVSYIDSHHIAVDARNLDTLERLGRLSDDEWNAIF